MRKAIILLAICLLWAQTLVYAQQNDELGFARKLYQNQMYELAAEQLRQFLRNRPTDPNAPSAQLLLAHSCLKAGNFSEALRNYQDFIVNYPEEVHLPEAWEGCAQAWTFLKKPQKAAETYLKIQVLFPGSHLAPQALLEAGKIFYENGQTSKAIQALKRLIAEYKDSPLVQEAHYRLGSLYEKKGALKDALSEFTKVSATRLLPHALLEITRIRLKQNNLTEAQKIFGQLEKNFPESSATAQAAILLTDRLREEKGLSATAELLHQVSRKLNPEKLAPAITLDLANSCLLAGEDSLSAFYYQSFLKNHPQNPRRLEAIFGLEKVYLKQNNLTLAQQSFRKLLALAPDSKYTTSSYRLLAQGFLKNGQPLEAVRLYSQFLTSCQQEQEVTKATFELAKIYQRDLHWLNRAVSLYQKLAQGTSAMAESSQFALAQCLEQKGNLDQAREEYQLLLQRFPTGQFVARAQQRLNYLQEFSPNWKKAAEGLVRLLTEELTGGSKEQSLYNLALICYRELKDFENAAAALKIYIEKYPRSSRADSACYLLAQCYLKLQQKYALAGKSREVKESHRKAVEAYQTLVRNYPKSKLADDAALFLIEETLPTTSSGTASWQAVLSSYQHFLETYPETDHLDLVLLRIGDAYRQLSLRDSSSVQKAISIYQKLAMQFPHSPYADDAWFKVGTCEQERGNTEAAVTCFRTLLSRYPHSELSGKAHFQLGRLFFQGKDFQKATAEFRILLNQGPPSGQSPLLPYLYLAKSYVHTGQPDQAAAVYRQILNRATQEGKTHVTSPAGEQIVKQALLGLASLYEKEGKQAEALELYDRFLSSYPQDSSLDSVLFHKGKLLLALGEESKAVKTFQELTQKFTTSAFFAEAAEQTGSILFHQKKYQDALSAYSLALSVDPKRIDAAGGRVLCLLHTGEKRKAASALRDFKRKFSHSPKAKEWNARFEYEQGIIWLEQKAYEKAEKQFQKVLKQFPETELVDDASYHLALCLLRENKTKKAIQALNNFCEKFPTSVYIEKAYMTLGGFYYTNRHFAEAADAYQKVLADTAGASVPDAMFNLILTYERLGQLGLAIETAKDLVARFPDYESTPRVKVKIGILLMELQRYKEAIEQFRQCLQWSTGEQEAEIRYYLAECYFNSGEYQKALYWYLRVAYLNPDQQLWAVTAQYKAGETCEKLNKLTQAENLYRQIISRYGVTSEWGQAAKQRLKNLRKRQSGK